jgi:hypothetical protein
LPLVVGQGSPPPRPCRCSGLQGRRSVRRCAHRCWWLPLLLNNGTFQRLDGASTHMDRLGVLHQKRSCIDAHPAQSKCSSQKPNRLNAASSHQTQCRPSGYSAFQFRLRKSPLCTKRTLFANRVSCSRQAPPCMLHYDIMDKFETESFQ